MARDAREEASMITTAEAQHKLTAPVSPAFDPIAHRYSHAGASLISVSALIARHKRPFDERGNATRVARREGRSVEDVLAAWATKRDAAMDRGKQVHAEIERALEPHIGKRCAEINPRAAESPLARHALAFLAEWSDAELVAQEARLMLPESRVAGTLDLLVRTPAGELVVLDWKTNAELRLRAEPTWRDCKMLAPVAHLDDVAGSHYALQLSAYRLMLEARYDLPIARCAIVHLEQHGADAHLMPDLRGEVQDILRTMNEPTTMTSEVPW
jgi:ATP-dependent exoDNAse (exonuclease V) beta subunit